MSEDKMETTEPKVRWLVDPKEIMDATKLNPADLSNEMTVQASTFAYYSTQLAKAERQVDRFKMRRDLAYAKCDRNIRDSAAEEGTKLTEKQIEQQVNRSRAYVSACDQYSESKEVAAVIKGCVDSLRHKRDMLIQMGLMQREEMKGELSIRAQEDAVNRVKNKAARAMETVSGD